MAIRITKANYIMDTNGITNVSTSWKVTSDLSGLVILDQITESIEMVNQYFSSVLVPIDTPVYVWYSMKMSNGEVKDFVGPIEYVNRTNNVTNVISPLARVDTPILTLSSATPVDSNIDTLTINTSSFRGDEYDGLAATTWYVKADGKIIYSVIESDMHKTSISISKQALSLGQYNSITIGAKHHSSNNGSSEFGKLNLELTLYPFKYVGDTIISSIDDFKFDIVNNDNTNNVYMSAITLREVSNSEIVYQNLTPTNNTTIPSTVLNYNTKYKLEITIKHADDSYTSKMIILIGTEARTNVLEYDRDYEFDISNYIAPQATILNVGSNGMMAYGYSLVMYNKKLYKIAKDVNDVYSSTILTMDATLNANVINGIRAIPLDNGDIVVLIDNITSIKVYKCKIISDVLTTIPTYAITLAKNSTIDLYNNVTVSEDYKHMYMMYIDNGGGLRFNSVELSTLITTILPNMPLISEADFISDTLFLGVISSRYIATFGGKYNNNKIYKYDMIGQGWVLHGLIPDDILSTNALDAFKPNNIKLKDGSILFTNALDITTLATMGDDININIVETTNNVIMNNRAFVRPDGTLYWLQGF